jgi:PPM family protein phosphatase
MTLVLRYSARSDRGLVRQNNQDAVYAGPRLLALADGMGGHAAGEVASSLVITALAQLDEDTPGDDLLGSLHDATAQGNAAITRHVAESPDLEGMGTTLTAILFAGNRLGLVHVGDSRAYQLRDGVLTQITKDDTFVQSLIDEGRITEEEAHTHPQRSLLLRAITGQDVEPSLTIREARAGDRFLLCSDGLSGVVSDETLQETLQAYRDPRECADRMIELALRGGGPDNVTCIVADVVDIDFGEDDPIMGGSVGGGMDEGPQPDSPAARASAATMTRPAPRVVAPVAPAPAPRSRWRLRLAVLVAVALVLLVGGGALARLWVLQQYYVGADSDQVAIFQGVRGDVLGIPLHQVAERTGIALQSLPETDRSALASDGIGAYDDIADARQTVDRLRNRMLPPCAELVPPAPQVVVVPTTPVVPPGLPPAVPPADPNNPLPPAGVVPTTPPVELTPLPTVTPEPGLNCRPGT